MASVRFFAPDTDAYVASVERHIGEFEERTGHTAHLNIIDSDRYFSNKIHAYLMGENAADVFMSGPVLLWEHVAAELIEPLDDFMRGATESYHPEDFIDSLLKANRWSGRFGDKLGSGPLLEIPVNCESYNLAYVPESLDRCGVNVPTTWAEFFATAQRIMEKTGGSVRGFGQRGVLVWHTVYTGYATQFWSYGGTDFDESGRCVIDSPPGVSATQAFIDGLKSSGPKDWLDQRWYELALDFAKGKYGLLVDSDHYVAFFENPELSNLAGKMGYALPPQGPSGLRKPNLWTWSVVMNARSRNKQAAWDFIEWATSREFLLRSAFEGNMNPTRKSVWDDPLFIERTERWGDFYKVSRNLVEELGQVLVTPVVNYLDIATRWTQALREAYAGADTVQGALEKAAREIDGMVSTMGWSVEQA
jgi:multiple sugar transport system substrate-binding protein